MELDKLALLEQKGFLRIRRTRDFRIDEYPHRGRIDTEEPERIRRVAEHKRRVQSDMIKE